MLKRKLFLTGILAASSITSIVHADSILQYELSDKDGKKIQQTISISGRWLRLDSTPKGKSDHIIMDMGRLIMFEVDDKAKNYQMTRLGRLYWPSSTAAMSPRFKPVPKKNAISGVKCQPVNEIGVDNKTVSKHCMSTGGSLGLNAREVITLSRLFMSARRLGLSWPSVATADERQVSIFSQEDGVTQQFKSVTHGWIPRTQFKVPVDYKRLLPDLPLKQNK